MMTRRTIVNGAGFCAVLENDLLVEYIPKDTEDQCSDIIAGKVNRLMPGMDCAFADIGRARDGFLPLREESASFTGGRIRSGEMQILQIRKEETGTKGAFLTRDITIPGRTVILMPMNRYIGVSSRIQDTEQRAELKKTGQEIAGNRFGLIMRNASAHASADEIRGEAEMLFERWNGVLLKAHEACRPGTVLFRDNLYSRLLEDYAALGIYDTVEMQEPDPMITRQLKNAADRQLRLPGGGNIVIDRCEAMTVIDVNTASAVPAENKEETLLRTNLEACELIARQVRLRNLSGIVLIDFIDMDRETDQGLVLERITDCFRADRIKTVIHGWTHLGLLEMTRKRTRAALMETCLQRCETCGGKGYILRGRTE